jgi:ribosomal protein S18 acetylase RimI-like enzyme
MRSCEFDQVQDSPSPGAFPIRSPSFATLVVLPTHRGQHIGSALIDAAECRLRELGVEDMVIGVVATNADALRLYERRGAVPFVTGLIQRVAPD